MVTVYGLCGTKSEHLEKKERWTFEGESFEESLLIFGRMLADEVRRSGLRAYLPRGYILVAYRGRRFQGSGSWSHCACVI